MGHAERNEHKSLTSNLHNYYLQDKDANHDSNKQIIIKEIFEDIDFFFLKFSCIEEIKYLQIYENIEEKCEMLTRSLVPLLLRQSQWTLNPEVLISLEEN